MDPSELSSLGVTGGQGSLSPGSWSIVLLRQAVNSPWHERVRFAMGERCRTRPAGKVPALRAGRDLLE